MSPNQDTPESSIPSTISKNTSTTIVWRFDNEPLVALPEPPPKRKRGRPKGSKNKPRLPGEKRTSRGLYDIQKQRDGETELHVFLSTQAFPCREDHHGSGETLAVITGCFHRFCGVSKVSPRTFVEILTKWAMELPEPWLIEKECSAGDSWWRKFSLASLDVFATLITGTYRKGRRLGGSQESQMYRMVSVVELWHYLRFRDSASSYWQSYVCERECQKNPSQLSNFETWRRELAANTTRLGSFLRGVLKDHFANPFEEIQTKPNRRDILEGRIANIERQESSSIVTVSQSTAADDLAGLVSVIETSEEWENNLIKPLPVPRREEQVAENEEKGGKLIAEGLGQDQVLVSSSNSAVPSVFAEQPKMLEVTKTSFHPVAFLLMRPETNTYDDRKESEPHRTPESQCQSVISAYSDPGYIQTAWRRPLIDFLSAPTSMFNRGRWNRFKMDFIPLKSVRFNGHDDRTDSTSCCFPMASVVLNTLFDWVPDTEKIRKAYRSEFESFGGNARNYDMGVERLRSDWRDVLDQERRIECLNRECHACYVSNPTCYQDLLAQLEGESTKLTSMRNELAAKIRELRKVAEQLPNILKHRMKAFTPSCFVYPRQFYVQHGFRSSLEFVRYLNREQVCENGLIHVDLDLHNADKAAVAKERLADSGLFSMVAISVSGTGVYGISRYDRNYYGWEETGFTTALQTLWCSAEKLGYGRENGLDVSCKDVTRRRFGSGDPTAFVDWSGECQLPNVNAN